MTWRRWFTIMAIRFIGCIAGLVSVVFTGLGLQGEGADPQKDIFWGVCAGTICVMIFKFAGWCERRPIKPRRQRRPKPSREEAPQRPPERRFAPIPMAEPVQPVTHALPASMPANLRRFIERGEQAITKPPD
jgi:hypothetical protein